MTHPARTGLGLVGLGNSEFVLENPEQDVRGSEVFDPKGQRIGGVDDLYIDEEGREVRFLGVSDGGFLGIFGMGQKRLLIPVEAVTEVVRGMVIVEPGRTEKADGPDSFDAKVVPPPAGDRGDGYGPPPFSDSEGTASRSAFPYNRRPY